MSRVDCLKVLESPFFPLLISNHPILPAFMCYVQGIYGKFEINKIIYLLNSKYKIWKIYVPK